MISLVKLSDPAPALGRGLAILKILATGVDHRLEDIALATRLPKASALRLLRSLAGAGAAMQTPDRRWRALCRITSCDSPHHHLLQRISSQLAELALSCNRITECWLCDPQVLRLHARVDPPHCDISLKAGIGFVRTADEIEATVQIAMAWNHVRPSRKHWHWRSGTRALIGPQALVRLITQVRKQGTASDLDTNINGVRRLAAPILMNDRLIAVLAIAVLGHVDARDERQLRAFLASAAQSLSES